MFSRFTEKFGTNSVDEAAELAVDRLLPQAREIVGRPALVWLCQKQGIEVHYQAQAPFEGRLERTGDNNYTITLRSEGAHGTNSPRMRFTLAHELGHWIAQNALDEHKANLFRGVPITSKETSCEESLANILAAEILMPRKLMKDFVSSRLNHDLLAEGIDCFNVSRQAFISRYAAMARKPVLYIKALPTKFQHVDSIAKIDDCWLSRPRQKPRRMRGQIYFAEDPPFNQLSKYAESMPLVWSSKRREVQLSCKYKFGIVPKASFVGVI